MKAYSLLIGIILLFGAPKVLAEKVFVAVASNFSQSMRVLQQAFEAIYEHQVLLTFGSSGKFYAQIKQGAPYDLFFSADQTKAMALEQENLIVPGSRFTYAIGRLALWSVKVDHHPSIIERFQSHSFDKLAMANPKLAPYGQAAMQTLAHMQMLNATQSKWIIGENVSQVYQFVSSGNADLGFVAFSQIVAQEKAPGLYWLVPETFHQAIKQDVVWLKRAQNNVAAKALLDFIHSEQGRNIITQQGYSYPQEGEL